MELSPENPQKDMVRMELNIERLPEIFNKQAYKNGVRTIVRRNQRLEIGLEGMKVGFSHHEYLVLVEVVQMWDKLGRPRSGEIYRNGESLSLSKFTDNLYSDERKFRTGKNYRKRVERWIKNLLTIPLLHYVLTPEKNGDTRVALGSFTFLSAAEGIIKKDGNYFDLSKITLHPTIVKSLLSHHVKPIRLDVIRTLRGDNETLFYRELDLILSRTKEVSRPLIPFCNDLGIHYGQERDYTAKAKKICKKLIRKSLSAGGVISHAFIQPKENVPWLFVLKGTFVEKARTIQKSVTSKIFPTQKEIDVLEHEKFLLRHYENFSKSEKEMVEKTKSNFIAVAPYKESPMTQQDCFYRAIESVLKQESAKQKIADLVACEPDRYLYKTRFERAAFAHLASILKEVASKKQSVPAPV